VLVLETDPEAGDREGNVLVTVMWTVENALQADVSALALVGTEATTAPA
jgi:hypothetical protein